MLFLEVGPGFDQQPTLYWYFKTAASLATGDYEYKWSIFLLVIYKKLKKNFWTEIG